MDFTQDEIDRFWSRVKVGQPDECWEWQQRRALPPRLPYGLIRLHGKNLMAHRVAWMISNGPIPAGLFVCHHCDNPPCCNPSHLFVGTAADNVADRDAKGRQVQGERVWTHAHPERVKRGDEHFARRHPERMAHGDRNGSRLYPERLVRGETQWKAKLTEQAVREIRERRAKGESARRLSAEYGVTPTNIYDIVKRNTWRHVR